MFDVLFGWLVLFDVWLLFFLSCFVVFDVLFGWWVLFDVLSGWLRLFDLLFWLVGFVCLVGFVWLVGLFDVLFVCLFVCLVNYFACSSCCAISCVFSYHFLVWSWWDRMKTSKKPCEMALTLCKPFRNPGWR